MCGGQLCPEVRPRAGKKARPLEASDQKPLIVPQQRPRPPRPLDARSGRTLILITPIHAACRRDPRDEWSAGAKEATRAAPPRCFCLPIEQLISSAASALTDVISSLQPFLSLQIGFFHFLSDLSCSDRFMLFLFDQNVSYRVFC